MLRRGRRRKIPDEVSHTSANLGDLEQKMGGGAWETVVIILTLLSLGIPTCM